MPKIAIFMNSLAGGGMERGMLNLAKFFAKEGAGVDLLVASAKGPLIAEVPESINLIDLKSSKYKTKSIRLWLIKAFFTVEPWLLVLFFTKKLPKAIKSIPAVIEYMNVVAPDVILSTPTTANLAVVWAKFYCEPNSKIVIREASTLSQEIQNKNTLFFKLTKKFVKKWYNHADSVICVSKDVSDDLKENFLIDKSKLNVIYNILDAEMIKSKALSSEYNSIIDGYGKYILSAGRLEKQKDYETLIYAYHLVAKKSSVNLVIIGEGPERAKLEALREALHLTDRVHIPGFFVNPYPFIQNCEVFALSSRWEGCPNVMRESMLLGKKIISTDCAGVKEILDESASRVLSPVGEYEAYAKKLLDLIELREENLDVDADSIIKRSKELYYNLMVG